VSIKGTIDEFSFLPEQGGGVVCHGMMNGLPWATTTIKRINVETKQIETKSGSIYQLQSIKPGVWPIQLQMCRPELYKKLEQLIR
jgi:hypothetical protein